MKKGMWGVGALALVLITGLSVFYWAQVGKKVVTASTSVNGQELPIWNANREGAGRTDVTDSAAAGNSGHIFCHSVLDREPQGSGNTDLSAGT